MKILVVVHPVGVGATLYRKYISKRILQKSNVSVIRGDSNEICTLNGIKLHSKDIVSAPNPADHIEHAQTLTYKASTIFLSLLKRNTCVWNIYENKFRSQSIFSDPSQNMIVIKTYASKEFSDATDLVISLLDDIAIKSAPEQLTTIAKSFETSTMQ